MVAGCPQCQTRFRIAREKLGPDGARLRCKSCGTIFRVQPPPVWPAQAGGSAPRAAAAPAAPLARALVAEADAALAKDIAAFLARWRIEARLVHDGAGALLRLFRSPPALAVLGGHLPGVGSPALVEVVRRSGALPDLVIVRIAPSDEAAPAGEFDAHHTLEPGDLCEGLGPILQRAGIGSEPAGRPDAGRGDASGIRGAAPPRASAPAAPGGAAAPADPEVASAERLARIAISDIILYNEEKFARAATTGNVVAALEAELVEAREMFRQRVPERLRAQRDFLAEELERRARERA